MHVERAIATTFATTEAIELARSMACARTGAFCGPAAIAWISGTWHQHNDLDYDVVAKLQNKRAFPNGPRNFFGRVLPGMRSKLLPAHLRWQTSLEFLLRRESNNRLHLSTRKLAHPIECFEAIQKYNAPLVLRCIGPRGILNGLHYVVVFRVDLDRTKERVRMHCIDNGVFCNSRRKNWKVHVTPYASYRDSNLDFGSLITEARRVVVPKGTSKQS